MRSGHITLLLRSGNPSGIHHPTSRWKRKNFCHHNSYSFVGPVTLISAYAATPSSLEEADDKFCDEMATTIKGIPAKLLLFILVTSTPELVLIKAYGPLAWVTSASER